MNPVINEVLSCISSPVVCKIDDQEQEYLTGAVAVDEMADVIRRSHTIENICVQDGKICLTIIDRQSEIDGNNKTWMAEQKEKTGIEPSFF